MQANIHPQYNLINVICACGNKFQTRATCGDLKLDICSACHPFYTGNQRIIDTAGRVESFKKKFGGGFKAAFSSEKH